MLLRGWAYFFWIALVGLFAIHTSPAYLWMVGAAALLCSLLLMTRNHLGAMYMLPFACLAGPILSFQISHLGTVTIADVYLLLFATIALLHNGTKGFRSSGYWREYGAMGVLILLFWWLSPYSAETFPGLVNIGELAIIYLLTVMLIRKSQNMQTIMGSWIGASTLCCGLVILRYYQNEPLLLGTDFGSGYAEYIKASSDMFYRATFFYAGFFFIAAMAIILCLSELSLAPVRSGRRRVLFAVVMINFFTLFIMSNKTALGALVVAMAAIFILRPYVPVRVGRRRFAWSFSSIAVLVVFMYVGYIGIQGLISEDQLQASWERAQNNATLFERFAIYGNAVAFGRDHPRWLLMGLGPDAITRLLNEPQIQMILANPENNNYEGAIDSSYVSSLLEYGAIVCLLFLFVVFRTFRQLWKAFRVNKDGLALTLGIAIGTWMLMGVTQLTGTSKPTWLLVQLLAMAHVLISPQSGFPLRPELARVSSKLIDRQE